MLNVFVVYTSMLGRGELGERGGGLKLGLKGNSEVECCVKFM